VAAVPVTLAGALRHPARRGLHVEALLHDDSSPINVREVTLLSPYRPIESMAAATVLLPAVLKRDEHGAEWTGNGVDVPDAIGDAIDAVDKLKLGNASRDHELANANSLTFECVVDASHRRRFQPGRRPMCPRSQRGPSPRFRR
jgi:hypothetical protein